MDAPKSLLQSASRALLRGIAAALSAFFSSVRSAPAHVKEGFREARLGLRSSDGPTRRMSIVFYLSLVGVAATAYGFGRDFVQSRERARIDRLEADRIAAEKREKAEELRRMREPPPYQSMGTFSLELREADGVTRSSGLRAAEMEVVVACSDPSACEWVKENLDRARGELGPLFTPTDREKILSPSGKRAFREEIRESLNRLLEEKGVKGTILEVLFPRFIVS